MEDTPSAARIDQFNAEAPSSPILSLLNQNLLTPMILLGHTTGLRDVTRTMPAATSTELAKPAKLNERFDRKRLSNMFIDGTFVKDEKFLPTVSAITV